MKKLAVVVLSVALLISYSINLVSASTVYASRQTVSEAVESYQEKNNEKITTNRYYFLQPNGKNGNVSTGKGYLEAGEYVVSWVNEHSVTPNIYWQDTDIIDPDNYLGYVAMSGDAEDVYYADVPDFVTAIVWNNGVDYQADRELNMWLYAHQTVNIGCEWYDVDENENYPDGLDNFDNMIYVLDPDATNWGVPGEPASENGEWYYYYGNGCYGFVEDGDESSCLRADHNHGLLLGDADNDGDITIMDATAIQLHLAIQRRINNENFAIADVDGDSKITIFDATLIQQFVANIISEF